MSLQHQEKQFALRSQSPACVFSSAQFQPWSLLPSRMLIKVQWGLRVPRAPLSLQGPLCSLAENPSVFCAAKLWSACAAPVPKAGLQWGPRPLLQTPVFGVLSCDLQPTPAWVGVPAWWWMEKTPFAGSGGSFLNLDPSHRGVQHLGELNPLWSRSPARGCGQSGAGAGWGMPAVLEGRVRPHPGRAAGTGTVPPDGSRGSSARGHRPVPPHRSSGASGGRGQSPSQRGR